MELEHEEDTALCKTTTNRKNNDERQTLYKGFFTMTSTPSSSSTTTTYFPRLSNLALFLILGVGIGFIGDGLHWQQQKQQQQLNGHVHHIHNDNDNSNDSNNVQSQGLRLTSPKKNKEISSESSMNTKQQKQKQQVAAPSSSSQNKEEETFPQLSDLLHGKKVVGDVSNLLDFAIVGFPKCATSFLMRHYLGENEDVYINDGELCVNRNPKKVIERYYNVSHYSQNNSNSKSESHRLQFGLKCPSDLESEYALKHYANHFPNTKFIVTTRHPVWWFQSFYNYRTYQRWPKKLPPVNDLIGSCSKGQSPYPCSGPLMETCESQNVCTDRTNFHYALSRLGKTPMNTPEEKKLLGNHGMSIHPHKGKVFLMALDQLEVNEQTNEPLSPEFPQDLRDFANLQHDLPELYNRERPKRYSDEVRRADFINICDDEYEHIRSVLISNGRAASIWIRDYFLKSPDVFVSSRESFITLMEQWGIDPCTKTKESELE